MNKSEQSLKHWLPVLGWDKLPNFYNCHSHETSELFFNDYFESKDIKVLEDNIIETLKSPTVTQIRLTGSPGLGKTTFLYFILNKMKEDLDVFNQYCFYIFHANKAKDENDFERLTQIEIENALRKYYIECHQREKYNAIVELSSTLKERINRLRDFYKDNRNKFNKKFVIILDDIDMIEDELAFNIVSSLKINLETSSLMKWLVIRPTTFEHYTSKTKTFFTEFFPKHYDFKENSLYDVISKRIDSSTNNQGKNPFSKGTCRIIQKTFENNLRSSLPFLETLLQNNLPKNLPEFIDETFIQNYIEKMTAITLLDQGELPNVHSKEFLSTKFYPLAYDLLQIINHIPTYTDIIAILGLIVRHYRSPKISKIGEFQLRAIQVEETFKILEEKKLIKRASGKSWYLTAKAEVLVNDINIDTYNQRCKVKLEESQVKMTDQYWKALNVAVDYEDMALHQNVWE